MGVLVKPCPNHLDEVIDHGKTFERQYLTDERDDDVSTCGKGIECYQAQRWWAVE